MSVTFFENSRALDSLRHSDFDAYSAYGEVIDNSLQAGARNIHINFELKPAKNKHVAIDKLVFGDDGVGMDKETLHSCLKLGWSSRFNDRSGIGRFGVGMVLGAIHEVRRIEVYTKQKGPWGGAAWLSTYIDLDEIENGDMEVIPEPKEVNLPEKYKKYVGEESGTCVIWSNYDRQKVSATLMIEYARHWFGRTFRYFIWDGINIYLDNTEVIAHDPLYYKVGKTKFPNDPPSRLGEPFKVDWEIPDTEGINNNNTTSEIIIKTSLLPIELRKVRGAGGNEEATKRNIPDNEGVSILRNKREVFYGPIPYWTRARIGQGNTWPFAEIDRWWGCEILFNAEIDSEFSVKNIKRGAEPSRNLKDHIKQLITPTRQSYIREIQKDWDDQKAAEKKDDNDEGTKHKPTENTILNTPIAKPAAVPPQPGKLEGFIPPETNEREIIAIKERFEKYPYTIVEAGWFGHSFFEKHHEGQKLIIKYNMQSEFFKAVYDQLEQVAEEDSPQITNLKALLDMLIASVLLTQANSDPDRKIDNWSDFEDQFNGQMGLTLNSLVNTWKRNYKED